jgi:hypothetical protein
LTYIKAACNSIAQKVADGEVPPRKESDDGNGGWVRPKEVGLFKHVDPEEVRRETHELFHGKLELIEELALIKQLEQPAAEKPKTAACLHGRQKSQCKDCGTGHCLHGRRKEMCRDCGTGHCLHGRRKGQCKDCGTGHCLHVRRKGRCKDCGTGYCVHRRRKGQCKDCTPR